MTAIRPILAMVLLAAAAPLAATGTGATPAGTADTRYCMKVEPDTGSRVERTLCLTRGEWERQGVDLDADWPREGVRVEG